MPCTSPSQAYFTVRPDGKKDIRFSNVLGRMFKSGCVMPLDSMGLPCGQCKFCRLERSRETAIRCVHESRLSDFNSFITLTYNNESMYEFCPLTDGGYSLVRDHVVDFMKRLRIRFQRGFEYFSRDRSSHFCQIDSVRAFGCGEYGGRTDRPHYHFCLFNCHFPDRKFWKSVNGFKYYRSEVLESLWKFGHSVVCDFSFETGAYVARYCTKKITGKVSDAHYRGRLPEFPVYPTRGGGLGKPWFDKFAVSDIFPTDSCVARGIKCKVPRYYDVLRSRVDPVGLAEAKKLRVERAKLHADDFTYARLLDAERCMDSRIRLLIRRLEDGFDLSI